MKFPKKVTRSVDYFVLTLITYYDKTSDSRMLHYKWVFDIKNNCTWLCTITNAYFIISALSIFLVITEGHDNQHIEDSIL